MSPPAARGWALIAPDAGPPSRHTGPPKRRVVMPNLPRWPRAGRTHAQSRVTVAATGALAVSRDKGRWPAGGALGESDVMTNPTPAASSPRQLELCLRVPRSTAAARLVKVPVPPSAAVSAAIDSHRHGPADPAPRADADGAPCRGGRLMAVGDVAPSFGPLPSRTHAQTRAMLASAGALAVSRND